MLMHFFDIETTHQTPRSGELISMAWIVTDTNYNELGRFVEKCNIGGPRFAKNVFGREENRWPDPTNSKDPSKRNATDVHGILWNEAKDFQSPLDMWRKFYVFLKPFMDRKWKMVYHSESNFDPRWLFYRTKVWAPPLNAMLNNKLCKLSITEDGEKEYSWVRDDTMGMARAYIKSGRDIFKKIDKMERRKAKLYELLNKPRKTPATKANIDKWTAEYEQITLDMGQLEGTSVELKGWSLDKICNALSIPLKHHDAQSDAEALIPIHRFFTNQG